MRVYPRLGGDKIRGLKCCRFLHFARLTDIGTLDLIDDDKVCLTNLNRQISGSNAYVPADPAGSFAFVRDVWYNRETL